MKKMTRHLAISFVSVIALLAGAAAAYGGVIKGFVSTDNVGVFKPRSRTAKKIAFLRYIGEWGGEVSQLYTVRSNGSDLRAIGPPRRYDFASVSPDDKWIVTAVWQTSSFGADCAIMKSDGTEFVILVKNTEPATGCTTPAFSPDGSKIVFSINNDLMTMNADGTDRVVVLAGGFSYRPTFSRDGNAILANLSSALYLVSLEGGGRTLVSTMDAREAIFSADGTKIFFNSPYNLNTWPPQLPTSQIYVMNADGTEVEQLTFSGLNTSPVTTNKNVIFVSDRDSTTTPITSIYSMRPDGTGVRAVTHSPQWDSFNSILWWNPDNRGD